LVLILAIWVEGLGHEPITEKEYEYAKMFRRRMEKAQNNLKNSQDAEYVQKWLDKSADELLVNWVRYTDYDLEKSEKALLKSLEWKRKSKIDEVLNWEPPKEFKDKYPFAVTGFEDNGKPLLYIAYGVWDVRDGISKGIRDDMFKQMAKSFEEAMNTPNPETGELPTQFVYIVNMDKFSLRQVTSIRVLGAVASYVGLFEANYPLYPQDVFIVNAPSYFSAIFQILKNVLNAKAFSLLKIYAPEDKSWKKDMEGIVSPRNLPTTLGGEYPLDF